MSSPDRYCLYRQLAAKNRWIGGVIIASLLMATLGILLLTVSTRITNDHIYICPDAVNGGKAPVRWSK